MRRQRTPRTRKDLLGYMWSLHWELEREFTYTPEELMAMTVKELKEETQRMSEHLSRCPSGEDGVNRAKQGAPFAYKQLNLMGGVT